MKCVLVLILCLACVQSVLSCSCFPAHLQTKFCQSKFGIFAVPLSRVVAQDPQDDTVYTLLIFGVLKKSNNMVPFTIKTAKTAANGAQCGVSLQLFKPYVLGGSFTTGGDMKLNLCGLNRQLSSLTQCELDLLKGQESSSNSACIDCTCKVQYCYDKSDTKRCPADRNVCYWNQQDDKDSIGRCQRDWFSWGCRWKSC